MIIKLKSKIKIKDKLGIRKFLKTKRYKVTIRDKNLIRKFYERNIQHIRVEKTAMNNYWLYSDVPIEKLEIPEGLHCRVRLYKDGKSVEYLVLNEKNQQIAVLVIK